MNAAKLKLHAELLEREIQANLGKSKDVGWLAQYQPLVDALAGAREERIDHPCDLGAGLDRWVFESNIQDFAALCDRLSEFKNLLRDWTLSDESGS